MRKNSTLTTVLLQAFMTLMAFGFLIPLVIVVNYAFKTKSELYLKPPLALPDGLHLENFAKAIKKLNIATTLTNTFFYTLVSVLALVILCSAAAWAISRNNHKFFKFSYIYFLTGILIPAQALFLSIYIVGYRSGLVNTRLGIILMYIASGMSFGVFIMTSFMTTVPMELEEAARIDGCSLYRTFFTIVMPLLKPAVATLIIMQAFAIWNDYLMASLFVSNKKLITMTVAMRQFFSTTSSDYTSAMAGIVISALPMCILFLSLQKYFIKGMTVGAVKG
jgi:raffinose/stachyose/melibiose transport system permease protein